MRRVELDDKYTLSSGHAYMSGIQALVRLPMLQRDIDAAAGLDTAGFISGYRGSPLGNYDDALRKAGAHLAERKIHFQPGVNEDIAATALWGTQQVALSAEATVQGVFGIWYGKGPGVDRSMDVFKHANAAGTSRHGGVVAVMGDDHACKSSTLPHQSDQMAAAAHMPVLNPASIEDLIAFGLHGFALSRYSGCWVALKATTEIVESSAVVDLDAVRPVVAEPADYAPPPGGLGIRWPDTPLDMEARLHGPRMEAVQAFARRNPIDRVLFRGDNPKLAVVTTGKAHNDLMRALADLGLNEESAAAMGLAVYKLGMTWPIEPDRMLGFIGDAPDVLVIEEKEAFVETQLARLLVNRGGRHRLHGKTDATGRTLLPGSGEFDPSRVARALVDSMQFAGIEVSDLGANWDHGSGAESAGTEVAAAREGRLVRAPFFCSGCPHNTSTRVPEGSRAMAGIGCHGMAYSIPSRNTAFITQMGGEGAAWIGQAPFTREDHVFQNLGDGTYFHSGLLAIRAAAAAGVNITYKILYNDAVAMTGGQTHDGPMSVPIIARQVAAEGAVRIAVVTDEPEKYSHVSGMPGGTTIRHRNDLDAVQRELRATKGLTILIYDQTCAAEKRRRRKHGRYPDPPKRLFINDLVCEGCGDCSAKSNCIAVKPLETEFGRKRRIDQSDCNKDFSCLEGFCPSFVTVHGATPRRQIAAANGQMPDLPDPETAAIKDPFNILVTGIGGTGVVTIGALLGMAAHLDGKFVTVLDNTGLAQKNGSVSSHVRISAERNALGGGRIGAGTTDLLLACDMVVAASDDMLSRLSAERTMGVINHNISPTAAFVHNGAIDLSAALETRSLRQRILPGSRFLRAGELATRLMGDSVAVNLFLTGFAWQSGQIPLSRGALERAIELNGVAVRASLDAFRWGRLAAHDMSAIEAVLGEAPARGERLVPDLDEMVEQREGELVAYQDRAYADRYLALVVLARGAESARLGKPAEFTHAVAWNFYKLLAYKDEYEVARLYTDGRFEQALRDAFENDAKIQFHLAPPLLARRDRSTGLLRKRSFGPWMMPVFRLLAKLKRLRGTIFDPFGYQAERRQERAMADHYETRIRELCTMFADIEVADAVTIARRPESIAGFGHVKARAIHAAQSLAPQPAPSGDLAGGPVDQHKEAV
jgi:indolepyruvate ferredoxin oxidoreductase